MEYRGFIHGSYESQSYVADQERTVNWYPERMESSGASTKWALYPTPGVTQLSQAVSGAGRAHIEAAGREFAVIGTFLYEVGQFGAQTFLGTVAIGSVPATISYNGDGGNQLFITSGTNGYVLDMTTLVLTQIVALNGKATMGGHLDGYFLALDATTSTFYISNLLAGLTWNTGTDFAQRSQASDPWVSMKVNSKYIWLLGQETSEVWYDTGASFPFAPHPSGLVSYGCSAPFSVAQVGSSIVWVGTSVSGGAFVLQASGFTPEVISDVPLQVAMSGYTVVSDAVADSYTDLGHTFYVVSFRDANVTWAWDSGNGQWCERGTWISEDGEFDAWRPRFHAWAYGQHRILDSQNGSLYLLTSNSFTDADSRVIRRVRRAPALVAENQRVYYSAFELDMESGLGIQTGSPLIPTDPTANSQTSSQVFLRMSNDGGRNWGPEIFRPCGKLGAYGFRVRWNRLGMGRKRVFEIAVSSPVPWRIVGAYLTLGQSPQIQGAQPEAAQ